MALHSDEPAYFLLALSDGQRYFSTQQSATIGLASDRPDSAKLTLPAEFPRTAAEIRFKESAFEIVNRSYQHIVVDGSRLERGKSYKLQAKTAIRIQNVLMWFLLPVNEVEPREDAVNLRPERVKYIELLRKAEQNGEVDFTQIVDLETMCSFVEKALGQPVDREYIKPRICKSLNKKKGWLKRVGNGYTLLTLGEQQS